MIYFPTVQQIIPPRKIVIYARKCDCNEKID